MSFLDSSYASGSFLSGLGVTDAESMAHSTSELDRMQDELTSGRTAAPVVAREGASPEELAMVRAANEKSARMAKDGIEEAYVAPASGGTTVTRIDPATGLPLATSRFSFGTTTNEAAKALALINARSDASMAAVNRKLDAQFGIRPKGAPAVVPRADTVAKPTVSKQTVVIVAAVAALGLALLLMRKN